MPSVTDVDPTPERLHALDAVRGFALLLGIILHATGSFIPAPTRFWIIQDTHPSMTLALLFFVIHVFRMTTFFLMAGFFAHMSLHRRGAWGFVKDRMQRIALPLVVAWPIVFATLAVVVIWAAGFPNGGAIPGAPNWPVLPRFPLTHLWFLYVLLEFYAAMLLLRSGVVWLDRGGRFRTYADRLIAQVMRSPLAPAILAVPIGIAFSLDPTWVGWFGVRTPDESLLTNLQALIGFGTAFGFGWLLHRQIDLLRILEKRWLIHLAFAIGLIAMSFLVALSPALSDIPAIPIGIETMKLAGAAFYALAIWTTTFAAIGLAIRFMSGFSPTRRYLADASYWLYLIHLPIVVALQVAVSRLDWPWPIKFAIILVVAVPVMLASYHLLVRYTYIGIVLNGRRFRRDRTRAVASGFAAT
jgi:peptidoglycan/LPS O-acetylase OafA/YrhL